jgi:hypothetical protein
MSSLPAGLQLHLGCGTCAPPGWVNVDGALGARLARIRPLRPLLRWLGAFDLDWPDDLVIHDLRRRFPWAAGSARAVYSSHTLEHLTRDEGRFFLHECARVLAKGGVCRIVVPDLTAILRQLDKGELRATELLDALDVSTAHPNDPWWKRVLAPYVRFPHRCMYDAACLVEAMQEAGLEARVAAPLVSRIPDITDVETTERACGNLVVEGWKP